MEIAVNDPSVNAGNEVEDTLDDLVTMKNKSAAEIIAFERELYSVKYNWHYSYESGEDYYSHSVGSRNVIYMEEHDAGTPHHRVDVYYENGNKATLYNIVETKWRLKGWNK